MNRLSLPIFLLCLFPLFACAQQPVDIVIQTGHSSSVSHISWSNDGKYFASAASDGSVKLWDAKLAMEIFNWFPFSKWANYVDFSRNSKYLMATGSLENVLYDLVTGKKNCTVVCDEDIDPESGTSMCVFSPDGKYAFADRSSKDAYRILRWDLNEMLSPAVYQPNRDFYEDDSGVVILKELASAVYFDGHRGAITAMRITNNGKYLISSSEDSTIRIWDVTTNKPFRILKAPCEIRDIVISPDDKMIYSLDGTSSAFTALRQWNIATGKQVSSQPLQRGGKCISISPDGTTIAIGNYLQEIILFNIASKKLSIPFKGHTDYINAVTFSDDGTTIATAGNDKSIKIWDVKQKKIRHDLKTQLSPVEKLVYNKNHSTIVSLNTDNNNSRIITWETTNGIGVKNGRNGNPGIRTNDPFFIDSGASVILTAEDSCLVLREPVSGKLKHKIFAPYAAAAAMSHDGKTVILHNGKDGNFYKYALPSIAPIFFASHPLTEGAHVHTITFSADDKWIAAGDIGADVNIYNAESGAFVRNLNYLDPDSSRRKSDDYHDEDLDVSNAWVYDAKFSPDGTLLATACRMPDPIVTGGLIIVWDITTGKMLHWKNAHIYPIQSINWSPDGKYLITGSNDKFVKVWEYRSFENKEPEPVYQYQHDFTAMHTSFTADQQWIISGGIDGQIIIKDAGNYKTLATLISLDSSDYVAVTPEQYYAASKDGVKLISFRQGLRILPAAQFDLRYNRPDKVLIALGSRDTALIKSYKRAYEKRIKKLGVDTTSFTDGFSRPEAMIRGSDTIRYDRTRSELPMRIYAKSQGFLIDRFNVFVNDVPVYGQRGISIREPRKMEWDTTISLRLSQGENRIEVSIFDVNGTESYRQPLLVRYLPLKRPQPVLHFIGIGINHFEDRRYDLNWSVKDIRDLAIKFKTKYQNAIIDTLFDEQVQRDNILALKKKLSQLNEDDKVVIAYSGHGLFSKDFDYYLSTYNINFEKPELNGLNYEDLESLVDGIKPRQKLILLDACHSGEIDREEITTALADSLPSGVKGVTIGIKNKNSVGMRNSFELMQNVFVNVSKGTGTTIISAAGGTQFAMERGDLRNGVFTYSILEAFNKEKQLSVSALKRIVGERVKQLTNGMQVPTSRNETNNHDWFVW